jgi:hypothetical protein
MTNLAYDLVSLALVQHQLLRQPLQVLLALAGKAAAAAHHVRRLCVCVCVCVCVCAAGVAFACAGGWTQGSMASVC